MPDVKTYDLIVIGGGPAGITAASTAAEFHKSVALVDAHHELGGAGINTGTVPSKTLRETALALSGVRSRNLEVIDLSVRREATVADFLGHEQQVKATFNLMLSQQLKSHNAEVYFGKGSFVDAHTVRVVAEDGESLLRAERILIAVGSSPVRPPLFPFGQGEVYDSDTILNLDRLPRTMAVIGAGVIGSEYACTFATLGARVHIVDGRDQLLPFLDAEVSRALVAAMEKCGVVFHWNEKAAECAVLDSGQVSLRLSSGAALSVDAVLVAAGRKSNGDTLNLPAAGVAAGERGLLAVDENFRTNVPHIYASGDVIGFPSLASASMEQARRATRHALGLGLLPRSAPLLPNGIYTIPETSMVGETEETLRKQGVPYVVGRADYRNNARGRIIGDLDGFLKLLFRKDDMKLVGVHVLGEQATEIVHIGLMAMLTDSTADIFIEACFNIPTLSGLYKAAAFDALRRRTETA